MLRADAELVYQLRAHREEGFEAAVDNIRRFHGSENIAISRVSRARNEPETLIMFVTVFKLLPRTDPNQLRYWVPEKLRREFEQK